MTQINQYTNEILPLGGGNDLADEDLFDVDKKIDAIYESQRITWGTLQTYIQAVAGGTNYATTNLVWSDDRFHDADGYSSAELNQKNKIFSMNDADGTQNAFQVDYVPIGLAPQLGQEFFRIQGGFGSLFKVLRDGAVASYGGDFQSAFFGDSSPQGLPVGVQPNRNYIFAVAGANRKSIFTDQQIPDEAGLPLGADPFDSIVHFKSNLKGVLFPNLTTAERNGIPTPREGLVIYNTDDQKLQVYSGIGVTGWQNMN